MIRASAGAPLFWQSQGPCQTLRHGLDPRMLFGPQEIVVEAEEALERSMHKLTFFLKRPRSERSSNGRSAAENRLGRPIGSAAHGVPRRQAGSGSFALPTSVWLCGTPRREARGKSRLAGHMTRERLSARRGNPKDGTIETAGRGEGTMSAPHTAESTREVHQVVVAGPSPFVRLGMPPRKSIRAWSLTPPLVVWNRA